MAICPFAVKKLIRPGSNDPAIDVVGAILHVAVSEGESLYDYFAHRSGGIESHFYIRRDGTIEQYRDTGFEADANLKANSFYDGGRRKGFVSIETQGMGHGKWTKAQIKSIKRLLAWLSGRHDFPLRVTPGPFTSGVGYHTLHGSPSAWTPVTKSCPGPDRIKQFNRVLKPWFLDGDTPVTEEEVLSWTERIKNFKGQGGETYTARNWLLRIFNSSRRIDRQMDSVERELAAAHRKLDELLARKGN